MSFFGRACIYIGVFFVRRQPRVDHCVAFDVA